MNEKQAIERATEHGITVTTDANRWINKDGKSFRELSFRVGGYTVRRPVGPKSYWRIGADKHEYKRGDAINECVNRILEYRNSQA
jgi:argininosuccinate lyase